MMMPGEHHCQICEAFFLTQQLEHEMYTRNDFSTEKNCFPLYKKVHMKAELFSLCSLFSVHLLLYFNLIRMVLYENVNSQHFRSVNVVILEFIIS